MIYNVHFSEEDKKDNSNPIYYLYNNYYIFSVPSTALNLCFLVQCNFTFWLLLNTTHPTPIFKIPAYYICICPSESKNPPNQATFVFRAFFIIPYYVVLCVQFVKHWSSNNYNRDNTNWFLCTLFRRLAKNWPDFLRVISALSIDVACAFALIFGEKWV